MAFPTGYSKYQEITIDSSKVTADITDYVVFVNLADLVLAGADIFDSCRSDGGDIRVTKSDGTTELPVEIVGIDTTAKTGELYFKFSGTLSSTVDTVVRIWYNGTDTTPAVTATYGRNAVWSDFEAVLHFHNASTIDSTGNGHNATITGAASSGAAGKLGSDSLDFDGSNDYVTIPTLNASGTRCWMFWMNPDSWQNNQERDVIGYNFVYEKIATYFRIDNDLEYALYPGSGSIQFSMDNPRTPTGTWEMHHTQVATNDAEWWVDGVSVETDTSVAVKNWGSSVTMTLGKNPVASSAYYDGKLDEVRTRTSLLPDGWHATEHNNHNSPSTFYSVGAEQGGGGGGGSVKPQFLGFAGL